MGSAATVAVAAAMGIAACGGDDGSGGIGLAEVSSSGIEVASVKDARACLKKSFAVGDGSTPADLKETLGIEAQLTLLREGSSEPGAGSVSYYASLEQAEAARLAEDESKVPDTMFGRNENVTYVYSGENLDQARMDISGCL
jgi:hypothetical protein